ncbi:unnamed protein product [Echinostoma caproni]|uniref:Uncharacterized protein n=1 Tax=Echinostoma caproni TaxID=27848 RepID=A0A183AFQ4_9TREM|nr:unnamed protein product [Echinostoma caproni]
MNYYSGCLFLASQLRGTLRASASVVQRLSDPVRDSRSLIGIPSSVRITTITTTTMNWRFVMELPIIEQLNLQTSPSEVEEWVERFELRCSIRKYDTQNQSARFLTAGGRDLYTVMKNLPFPYTLAELLYESLK